MPTTKVVEEKLVRSKSYYSPIEYEMPKLMANEILNERKGSDKNMTPQAFLCKVVNDTFGIKGYCVKVTTV